MNIEQRLIDLEIKTAYQDDLMQELNKIVAAQQTQISRLEATCTVLHERLKSLLSMAELEQPEHQPPPHY
jgi:SlyX protein